MRLLSREESRLLDQKAAQDFGISTLLLMENAGRGAADLFCAVLRKGNLFGTRLLFICGKGNNGGDGFVMARHLFNRGFQVSIYLACLEEELSREPQDFFQICKKMKIPILQGELASLISQNDYLIDAFYGIGLNRNLNERDLKIVQLMNQSGKKIFSLDIPSGMDSDTGQPLPECVRAAWTATFAAPKKGFLAEKASTFLGDLCVVDIGIPSNLLQ